MVRRVAGAAVVAVIAGFFMLAGPSAEAAPPWYYSVTGPGGSNEITVDKIGQVLYFQCDATTADYVWGNVRIDFDPAMLECVSIEETSSEAGFWTAWVQQTADPAYGGGGSLYYYDSTGYGSEWAQWWVGQYGQGNAGPSGSYDNTQGTIRLYVMTYAGGMSGSVPLRIGYRVKQAGTVVFTTAANDWTAFGWPMAAASSAGVAAQTLATGEGYSWRLEDLPYQYTSTVKILSPGKDVAFDIKPATCPNTVNTRSAGVLPAAVLGTADVDISTIDVSSLRLAGVAPLRASLEDVGAAGSGVSDCAANGPDGLTDLALKFDKQSLLQAMTAAAGHELADGETVTVTLTGRLTMESGGTAIKGQDIITVSRNR